PTAVLGRPVLKRSAPDPTPELKLASVTGERENQPNAEFAAPVVTLPRALVPSAVLNEPPTLPGSGVSWACTRWQSAKQATPSRIAVNVMFRFFIIEFSFICLGRL